jgi:RecA/RadA recombinase
MANTLDLTKFRKDITKSIPGLSVGFHDPKVWISTGNYALNYAISGRFKDGGIPLGKVTMLGGQSGCLPSDAVVCAIVRKNATAGSQLDLKLGAIQQQGDISVGDLRDLWMSGNYYIELDTPDGYQPVVNWFDKGMMAMVNVTLDDGKSTRCATNHLIQVKHENELVWKLAGELELGDLVLTHDQSSPFSAVVSVTDETPELCYDFEIGHENHRYWGDGISSHNSGKSFLASGNITANAQKKDVFVVLIDSENALDEKWLHALDVNTDETALLKLNMAMIDDVARMISDFMKDYKARYSSVNEKDRPRVLFVIDSLGMLLTPTDVNQFEAGDLKGDMGRKPKALAALVRNCVNMFGEYDVGLVCTNHSYASQDMFNPDDVISGGCLVAGNLVVMADQSLKPIEQIELGDQVKTMFGSQPVTNLWRYTLPTVSLTLEDGRVIECSGDHKFLVSNQQGLVWVEAKDLEEHDQIIALD